MVMSPKEMGKGVGPPLGAKKAAIDVDPNRTDCLLSFPFSLLSFSIYKIKTFYFHIWFIQLCIFVTV